MKCIVHILFDIVVTIIDQTARGFEITFNVYVVFCLTAYYWRSFEYFLHMLFKAIGNVSVRFWPRMLSIITIICDQMSN